ncbi:MAG: hypothetical protein RR800_11685 [Comamonas sp.]
MGLILLEALLALAILAAIVWWTMFSGRKKGELRSSEEATAPAKTHKNSVQDKSNPD